MVTPSYHPIIGGSESAVRILTTTLNEMGVHTDVMAFNMNQKWNPFLREQMENSGSFRVLKMSAFSLSTVLRINPLELLKVYVIPKPGFTKKFKDYDIIHFQGEADLSFPIFSYFTRKPKIFTSHANYARFPRLKRLFKLVFPRLADLYVAHELNVLSNLGVPKAKSLALISFGVDSKTFHPDETKRISNMVLFVGRIEKSKGLHILLEALSYLTVPTQLVIIGPKWDMKYADACMNTIEKISNKSIHAVKYLGAMDELSLVPWYQKAAVLVRPDLSGFSGGLTSLEALACGTPVIGTGNHVIKDGVNGLIVRPSNARELAKALNKLLENKELREKYGREGRKMVESNFSWEKIAERLIKVYRVVLSNYQQSQLS